MAAMKLLVLLAVLTSPSVAEIIRGPYVQLARDDGMTVVWRTDRALKSPEVHFGLLGQAAEQVCKDQAILRREGGKDGTLSGTSSEVTQYEAQIDALKPGTVYWYTIHEGDSKISEKAHFKTHPAVGQESPTRIWVVGDSGTGGPHQKRVHEAMRTFVRADRRALDVFLHVGDMAYTKGTNEQFQERFFDPYEETLKETVCWASMGNHEGHSSNGFTGVGPYYDAYVCPTAGEAGGVASGKESYYSFDFGEVHFVCLNSHDIERRPDGDMAKWLNRDLAETQAKWVIAFFHHPPYTKGTHDSDTEVQLVEMRKYIMPILEAHGVDLVLAGHSHIYERSMLIDKAYATPTTAEGVILDDGDGDPAGDGPYKKSEGLTPHNGTVSIVTGHGGALGRNAKGLMPIMRSIVMERGSVIIDVDGDTLNGTMLDSFGKIRDRFGIVKDGLVNPSIQENPWTPGPNDVERTGNGVVGSEKTATDAHRAKLYGEKHPALLLPKNVKPIIPRHAPWDYLAGGEEPETEMWTKIGFDPKEEGWKRGPAGFGYGDDDDRTVLDDMKGRYERIFIRKEVVLSKEMNFKRLGLAIDYDDGFVLHVNGQPLLSRSIEPRGRGLKPKVRGHEAGLVEYFPLKDFASAFRVGKNAIAIEGFNVSLQSSDLSLDPWLVLEED